MYPKWQRKVGLLLLLLLGGSSNAVADDVTIPLVNRPANFSGAAGNYRMEVNSAPTTVRVEDPITLTLKIISQGPGPWANPPQRDKLRLMPPDLETAFFVEPLPEDDRFLPAENAWEFAWRLMPKHEGVKEIPALEFVYYSPSAMSFKAADGGDSIALEVKERPRLLLKAPASNRELFQRMVTDDELLAPTPSTHWRIMEVVVGLALPPILCFAGYALWRQMYPEASVRWRRRRTKALKTALSRLRQHDPSATTQLRGVVLEALGLLLGLAPGRATPLEIKAALTAQGARAESIAGVEDMLRACDESRFSPQPPKVASWATRASMILQGLETELCNGQH